VHKEIKQQMHFRPSLKHTKSRHSFSHHITIPKHQTYQASCTQTIPSLTKPLKTESPLSFLTESDTPLSQESNRNKTLETSEPSLSGPLPTLHQPTHSSSFLTEPRCPRETRELGIILPLPSKPKANSLSSQSLGNPRT
jgi:hypothetical protein